RVEQKAVTSLQPPGLTVPHAAGCTPGIQDRDRGPIESHVGAHRVGHEDSACPSRGSWWRDSVDIVRELMRLRHSWLPILQSDPVGFRKMYADQLGFGVG